MVHTCCVFKCQNRASNDKNISFHSFPSRKSDKDRFDAWVRAVNRQSKTGKLWLPSEKGHDKVCSEHFLQSDFRDETSIRSLIRNAIPCVFPHHSKHTMVATPRRPPTKRSFSPPKETNQPALKYRVIDDHNYASKPLDQQIVGLKEWVAYLETSLQECRHENKLLKEKLKRRENKCTNLMDKLKTERIITDEQASFFSGSFDSNTMALIENELRSKKFSPQSHRYSKTVKSFAITMHFYSAQAYNYLRSFFHLPSPSAIRKWACSINCEPGFLTDVLSKLGNDLFENEQMKDVCIMFDAMAIRKEYIFDKKSGRFAGGVDLGNFEQSTSSDLATEALVFMVVGLRGHWKQPFGYFLGKFNGEVQCQLVKHAISLLSEKGFAVHSVTCDGSFTNQSTAQMLGCTIDADKLNSSFPHPDNNQERVCFLFDASHLVKGVRNCVGDLKVLKYRGKDIRWAFIENLHALQLKDDLHLANKLKGKHVHYEKMKMNVKLAAQTLSNSVADAIDFLREEMSLREFQGSEATTEFIRNMDSLFDLCNSSSPIAKQNKSPLNAMNLPEKLESFNRLSGYIMELTDSTGKQLVYSRRKASFVGFLATAQSLGKVCTRLLERESHPLKYVLTYKTSQDHLELLFCRLRRRGGWNNNPNALQLKWALRSLLQHNGVQASTQANCISQTLPTAIQEQTSFCHDAQVLECYTRLLSSPSVFHDSALYYIAGYICRKIVQRCKCPTCAAELYELADNMPQLDMQPQAGLIRRKNRGGLLASNDFYTIVKATDVEMRRMQLQAQNPLKAVTKPFLLKLQTAVSTAVRYKVFANLQAHFMECHFIPEQDDHGVQTIKAVVEMFAHMLLKQHTMLLNQRYCKDNKPSVRHHLTKTILFLNQ